MTSDGDAAPQLTDNGAKLLAEVLAKRATAPDALAAQRDERRREADAMFRVEDEPDLRPHHPVPEPSSDNHRTRRGLVIAMAACVVAMVVGVMLIANSGAQPSADLETQVLGEVSASATQDQNSGPNDSGPNDSGLGDGGVGESDLGDTVRQASSIEGSDDDVERVAETAEEQHDSPVVDTLVPLTADDVTVSVYDTAPSNGDTYSFALRIKSVTTAQDVPTEEFVIAVESELGVGARTFSRFVHDSLPVNSSALATVRAEDAGSGEQFVVVSHGDVMLARIAIETTAP